MTELRTVAEENFARHLARNAYPGRGLVMGRAAQGTDWLQVYWIMGRSPNSRNRIFVAQDDTLRTEPFDPKAVQDPSLIIYEAMLGGPGIHVVSNGHQTRAICRAIGSGGTFESALASWEREPDAPNYTPRISGLIDLRFPEASLALSILKASPADPARTDRFAFRPAAPPPGLGLGLTTYRGDGTPLPPFEGEPLWLPLEGEPGQVLERYWEALDAENRVSLAVKRIPSQGAPVEIRLRNRHPAEAPLDAPRQRRALVP